MLDLCQCTPRPLAATVISGYPKRPGGIAEPLLRGREEMRRQALRMTAVVDLLERPTRGRRGRAEAKSRLTSAPCCTGCAAICWHDSHHRSRC
jgi:hypothetical protein